MKKFLIIIMAVGLFCGAVYLGVAIFGSLNVKEIEIVGQMQQIYFVGDDVNFGDAKLKVTYQNGDMKMIDLKKNVKVSLFSTSGYGKYHGTMKITYKSQTTEVDYTVLDRTSYIVSNIVKKTSSGTTNVSQKSKKIIEFGENGICKYFEIKNGKYFLHDGNYDNTYNYKIIGDIIYLNLGSETYELKANVDGNNLNVIATSKHYASSNSEIIDYIIESEFETTNLIKTNNYNEKKTNLTLYYGEKKFTIDTNSPNKIVLIPKGKTINESGICLMVDYDNGEIYYVYITQDMLTGNINESYNNQSFNLRGYYEGREFTIFYKVV